MPNYNVTNNIDTLLRSTSNAAARTNLGLGDAATKNTGTTAGTVAAGDDSRITGAVQKSGDTMTGKLTAAASDTEAKLNIGAPLSGANPSTLASGDIWISNQSKLAWRAGTSTVNAAGTTQQNTFNQPQTIGSTANAAPVLSVSNTGSREAATFTAQGTSPAVRITQTGTGESLRVEDEANPDATPFVVSASGRVGIGTDPDATVALKVDATGIKFNDGTVQTTAATGGGGSGTVTSITAGTGLTGGTITTSGTVAADFGTTTGKVTEGGTTVLKAGDTMTGKLTLTNTGSVAPLNIGSQLNVTTLTGGDVWLNSAGVLSWRTAAGATIPAVTTSTATNFTAGVGAAIGSAVTPALVVAQNGSNAAMTVANVATSTSDCVTITNLGTGNTLVVNDETTPDSTRFAIANNGKVGIGVAPDATAALSVDTNGIKFGDGTIQTTASGGGVAGVSSFSAGTTGLTPATGTTGAVTLAGTLTEANGGTGETAYTNGQLLIGNAAGGLTKATLTAGSNVTITNGDGAITIASTGGGGGGSTTQVDVYTTSQTITIPAGAKMLYAWACGGGGGGGSGTFSDGVNAPGGGGASGGSVNSAWVSVANLVALGWSSLSVIVGAGGAGGAAITTASSTANGNSGNLGSTSGLTKLGFSIGGSDPGLVGTGNTATAGGRPTSISAGGSGGSSSTSLFPTYGTGGGTGGTSASVGSNGIAQTNGFFGSTGGGGGGGFAAAGATVTSGGGGGGAYLNGAIKGGTNGVDGVRVAQGFSSGIYFQPGCGGGGGSGGNKDGYQDGGDGGFPGGGGGGGGGAGINPTSGTSTATRSGKGGNGANGQVILTWYF
jgi:hypothetical protein